MTRLVTFVGSFLCEEGQDPDEVKWAIAAQLEDNAGRVSFQELDGLPPGRDPRATAGGAT